MKMNNPAFACARGQLNDIAPIPLGSGEGGAGELAGHTERITATGCARGCTRYQGWWRRTCAGLSGRWCSCRCCSLPQCSPCLAWGQVKIQVVLATVKTVFNVHFDFQGYWSCNRYSEEFWDCFRTRYWKCALNYKMSEEGIEMSQSINQTWVHLKGRPRSGTNVRQTQRKTSFTRLSRPWQVKETIQDAPKHFITLSIKGKKE